MEQILLTVIIVTLGLSATAAIFVIALNKVLKSKGEVEVNMKLKAGEFNIKKSDTRK
jgi:hypothetical protein